MLGGDDMVDVLGRHGGILKSVVTKADQLKAARIAKKDEEDRIGFDKDHQAASAPSSGSDNTVSSSRY